jgi:hypothetical protein
MKMKNHVLLIIALLKVVFSRKCWVNCTNVGFCNARRCTKVRKCCIYADLDSSSMVSFTGSCQKTQSACDVLEPPRQFYNQKGTPLKMFKELLEVEIQKETNLNLNRLKGVLDRLNSLNRRMIKK